MIKRGSKKYLSLLQISILILGIIAINYFLGGEFKFVSAAATPNWDNIPDGSQIVQHIGEEKLQELGG